MVAGGIVNFSRYISPEIAAAGLPEIQAARADLRKQVGRYLCTGERWIASSLRSFAQTLRVCRWQ
jgi:hypothetical protein